MKGRVLIIAGSDSGGGAGVQADLKTVTVLGGYAASAITALTAQNTQGVFGVTGVDPSFIRQQIEVVLDDIGADCIKTGMLHNAEVIETVTAVLESRAGGVPLVVDPVMHAKGGASLLDPEAADTLKIRLIPHAAVLTPNLPEAEALTGIQIADLDTMKSAAEALLALGTGAVIVKGGRSTGATIHNVLRIAGQTEIFEHPRLETNNTHGTGCTLASAIATGLAQGLPTRDAIARAFKYVRGALESAPGLGGGHGPLNHGFCVPPFPVASGAG